MRRHAAGPAPHLIGGRATTEALEPRVLFAAGAGLAGVLDPALIQVVRESEFTPAGAGERVAVTVTAQNVRMTTAALAKLGFKATASRPSLHFVEGTIPVAALGAVASVSPRVRRFALRPSYAPVTFAGSVTSQADGVMEADRVRGTLPAAIDGTGQRVGVLSDSFNVKGGANADIASGDLPAAGVNVFADGAPSNTDEGRAMLQLVHDVAPGASLAFATANGGEAAMAANIRRLADPGDPSGFGGATVIVDDIAYPTEPMFQDGVVAQAIDDVVTSRGVAYFSAAGNLAGRAYESTNFQAAADSFKDVLGNTLSGTFFDFNPDPAAVDTRQRITIPAGARFFIDLQWDDPWFTASGVDADLDAFLVNPATNRAVSTADRDNIQAQEPSELLSYTNSTAAPQSFDLLIRRVTGASTNPGHLKYINYGSSSVTIEEWATNAPAVIPHAAAAEVPKKLGRPLPAPPFSSSRSDPRKVLSTPLTPASCGDCRTWADPSGAPVFENRIVAGPGELDCSGVCCV